jgi:hypothetical protein
MRFQRHFFVSFLLHFCTFVELDRLSDIAYLEEIVLLLENWSLILIICGLGFGRGEICYDLSLGFHGSFRVWARGHVRAMAVDSLSFLVFELVQ